LISAIDLSGHPRKLPIRGSATRGVGGKRGGELGVRPSILRPRPPGGGTGDHSHARVPGQRTPLRPSVSLPLAATRRFSSPPNSSLSSTSRWREKSASRLRHRSSPALTRSLSKGHPWGYCARPSCWHWRLALSSPWHPRSDPVVLAPCVAASASRPTRARSNSSSRSRRTGRPRTSRPVGTIVFPRRYILRYSGDERAEEPIEVPI
jgi:hypothetical protein